MEALANWNSLSESERQKIYSERRHHKTVTVFLHEIAHTLGAPHRIARDTIMSPVYDPNERGFDDATVGILRATLSYHLSATPLRAAAALRAALEKDDGGWVPSERASLLARLEPVESGHSAAPTTAASTPSASPALPPQTPLPLSFLTSDDRSRYDSAMASEKQGDTRAAWETAVPLFESYPRVFEVQDLRCRLAQKRNFVPAVTEAHCSRLVSLGGKP